jgi:DNA-binding NtrC family response regulator
MKSIPTQKLTKLTPHYSMETPISLSHPHRILMVDDEPIIRKSCSEALNDIGFQTHTADDGDTAWDKLQESDYRLLITDNNMNRLNGIDLIKKIHVSPITIPVILISGFMPTTELRLNPHLQVTALLEKPFTTTALCQIVKRLFGLNEPDLRHDEVRALG